MTTIMTIMAAPADNNNNKEQGWNRNTHLGVNLKTLLRSDRSMKSGKNYTGVLRRDLTCEDFLYDDHFTFVETQPQTSKRNPHVFVGQYITITRRDDGTLRPNFRPIPKGLTSAEYATAVANELYWALEGLVG